MRSMNEIEVFSYKSPVGELIIGTIDDGCCLLEYKYRKAIKTIYPRVKRYFSAEFVERENRLHQQIISELEQYFNGKRNKFDFNIHMRGTEFQETVWQELLTIPYGETISYQELARRIGKPSSVRAVANANGQNCMSIVIPCHRVIGKDGSLQGYGGGVQNKKKLLQLEQQSLIDHTLYFEYE
ncbi:MAG: methylated-DNA--[protein]-cysteine S-methyltransferase [Candidatus Heimdallarchaeota archaeon]|nr:methylated-DNA--[protein]-cysteine S-methyltransferase [Candidatus Heimdallarchaeota archaeon]